MIHRNQKFLLLSMALFAGICHTGFSFAPPASKPVTFLRPPQPTPKRRRKTQTKPAASTPPTTTTLHIQASPETIIATTDDPIVFESELLYDMAHIALDLTPLGSASKVLVRVSAIVGRLFVMLADYLPDHSLHPEELGIQLFLLGVALKELLQLKKQQEEETLAGN